MSGRSPGEVSARWRTCSWHPLTDAKSINERSAVFRYFRDHDFGFPFGKDEFDVVEQYIAGASGKRAFMNMLQIARAKAMFYISHDPEFGIIRDRIVTSIEFFRKARTYFDELGRDVAGNLSKDCGAWKSFVER